MRRVSINILIKCDAYLGCRHFHVLLWNRVSWTARGIRNKFPAKSGWICDTFAATATMLWVKFTETLGIRSLLNCIHFLRNGRSYKTCRCTGSRKHTSHWHLQRLLETCVHTDYSESISKYRNYQVLSTSKVPISIDNSSGRCTQKN